MPRDDERLAAASRTLRRKLGLTQTALVGDGKSRHIQRELEGGRAGRLQVDDLRAHFAKLDASVRVTAWWNGASLDRLIDAQHASIVEGAIRELSRYRWPVEAEVTFSEYGERGSIDVFAADPARNAVVVGEVKSAWGSIEETIRVLDAKVRLAPIVTKRRMGWTPATVASLLIFAEDPTARRIARRHSATLHVAFPARNREIRQWLRRPDGPLRGLWFLSNARKIDPADGGDS